MLPDAWSWTLFILISGSHYGSFFWRLLQFFGLMERFVCTNDLDLSPPLPKMEIKISCSLISSSLISACFWVYNLSRCTRKKLNLMIAFFFVFLLVLFFVWWEVGSRRRGKGLLSFGVTCKWRSHDLTFSVTSFQVLKCEYAVRGEIVTLAQVTKIYWLFIFGAGWYCCQSSRMVCSWINWLNE